MLALIIGLILFVVWLVRQAGGANRILGGIAGPAAGGETALDILKTRYARGEIDLAEYEEKKRELTR
ncbi:MAG: SHOCT domain-containing protein [Thermoleophilia bacterium]|nr:SHOCT domain-containing protein [Thermoleophilia bacterium]